MFLEDKLIFNLTQAKQQPRKDHIGKSLTHCTRQFLKRKLLPKKWINFYQHPFTISSENYIRLCSWIQSQLINFVSTELRKLSLGQNLFIYVQHLTTARFQNQTVIHFMIDYHAAGLTFSHWGLKEARGKSFPNKSSENLVASCPALSAGRGWATGP